MDTILRAIFALKRFSKKNTTKIIVMNCPHILFKNLDILWNSFSLHGDLSIGYVRLWFFRQKSGGFRGLIESVDVSSFTFLASLAQGYGFLISQPRIEC